jgi:hypothetical protein
MATRKKKSDAVTDTSPTVVKGSHLTVTTFSDGRTVLEWDDEALLREVREAIASAELDGLKPSVKAKVASRKKKEKPIV